MLFNRKRTYLFLYLDNSIKVDTMKFEYEKAAGKWLSERGFSEDEKGELLELLNRFEDTMKKHETELIILPKGTSGKVRAFFDLLYSITDANGVPTCFEKTSIRIPSEAIDRFQEGMEIHELEEEAKNIRSAKKARERMDPKRRGSKYG
jgi:hypothetical protein